jgi:hypothetical protein
VALQEDKVIGVGRRNSSPSSSVEEFVPFELQARRIIPVAL